MGIEVQDIALIVAWRERGGFQFGQVDTARAVSQHLRILVDDVENALQEKESRRYSIEADVEDNEYMTASLDGREEEAALRDSIVNLDGMDQVGSQELPDRPLTFYAVVLGNRPARRTAYIRKSNPMKVAKPGWGLFEFGDTLTSIANPVFVVEDRFDLILRPDTIDVLSPKVFESLFYELTGVDARVRGWVRNISRHLPMDDGVVDLLATACRAKPRLRRRLHAIQERGHLAEVTLQQFRREVRRHGYQATRFIRNGEIIADEDDYGVLLQILNEDLFRGGLTDEEFAAERKTPVHPQ
jgi:hypothetical protein